MSMKARLIVAISLFAVAGFNLHAAGRLEGYVILSLSADRTEFRAAAEAIFYSSGTNIDWNASLTGSLNVEQTVPAVNYVTPIDRYGSFAYILEGPTEFGACYYSSMQVTGDPWGPFNSVTETWNDGPACYTTQPPGGGGGGGGGNDEFENEECDTTCPPNTPIVINVADGAYRFSSARNGVFFDIDADGDLERVAWPSDVDEVGFLFLDRNGNGIPDSGSELFGDHTPLMNGQTAEQGFEALAELDSNRDSVISQLDAIWARLALWRDFDRNGTGGSGEISPLSSLSIQALHLDPKRIGRRDRHGNAFRLQAHLTLDSGAARPYYDVYLRTIQ